MKNNILLFSFLLLHLAAFSQNSYYTVSGKIIDADTKTPLVSASVFAQNTTIGTVTNTAGIFKLVLPDGGYNLVVSFVGYAATTIRISAGDANNDKIVISLKRKENSLEDVIIASNNEVKDGWEKYGAFFLQNFVGQTENSRSCSLINKEVLHFYFSKKRNSLKILTDTALVIANEALGYNIKYTLDSFVYDYNTLVTSYKGYPLFETMHSTDSVQEIKWAAARAKAYNGSILHFMRSYYNKQFKKDGFSVNFLTKSNDKEYFVPVLNFYDALDYSKDGSSKTVSLFPQQEEVVVIYNKAKPEDSFIKASPASSKKHQLSILTFVPLQAIHVEVNGYYFDQTTIIKSGYFSWLRIADTLPYDYSPQITSAGM